MVQLIMDSSMMRIKRLICTVLLIQIWQETPLLGREIQDARLQGNGHTYGIELEATV